jgi:hypothetical protein
MKNVSDIIKAVRTIIDENQSDNALITDDTLALDTLIESQIANGLRKALIIAPMPMIDNGQSFSDKTITWAKSQSGTGWGYLDLPTDFLRLLSFKMSDWIRPVVNPITPDDPSYAQQKFTYPGLRGTPQCPVVAIVEGTVNKKLEFFSSYASTDSTGKVTSSSTPTIELAKYVAYPSIVTNDSVEQIDCGDNLYQPMLYFIASQVYYSFGSKLGDTMDSLAKNLMGLVDVNRGSAQ